MSAFSTLNIANSSLGFHQTWIDALATNIANVNTATATSENAFQAQMVIATEAPEGSGVQYGGMALSDPQGRVVYSPDHPLADEAGNIRLPDVDMSSQLTQLIMAQRGFQASVQVTKTAQESYSSALSIGA